MNRRDALKIIAAAPIVGLAMPSDSLAAASVPSTFDPNNFGELIGFNPWDELPREPLKSLQLFFSPADKSVRCAINGTPYSGEAKVHHGDFFNNVTFVDGKMADAAFMFSETFAKSLTGISFDWNDFVLPWNLAPISDKPQSVEADIGFAAAEDFRSTFASQYEEA